MLLTMRRQNELIVGSQQHSSATAPETASTSAATVASPPGQNLSLLPSTAASSTETASQDSLNTPTTPLLGLSRNPLQFAPPPAPPPIAVASSTASGPAFGYYQTGSAAAPPLHHHPHPAATTEAAAQQPPVELDEYVDILQVQQLLLDSSAAAAAAANNPPPTTEQSIQQPQQQQSTAVVQPQQQQQQQQILAKPRPRINLQKATEYAAQLAQGKHSKAIHSLTSQISHHYSNIFDPPVAESSSPGSRRVLLDYPSPYLYGNPYHHHTPPSEDLVALWFGSNGTGE
ncbi:potassium/sodium hyperpolarization-activated cyclic nucleotide-gated channel 1-like isoform X1 [Drosophila eugracilis]|uniref:potassium/sodium hyperpolarization-activated cyclic nucleotide-gated channel 1-like isoform X1 n=1 Tax=Drosophila eugracilis TaxID=29029 RepID=UPI001BD98B04|nr:potassium/sodium hyperpolarization-activated cyclic nucleotide-gated channel 1-like isoform X1 [Drosophila eugracilis]